MIPILSLVTSVKDYLEVVHKLIEYDSLNINYTDYGSILTYFFITLKNCVVDFFSLSWRSISSSLSNLPIVIPDISAAMISEITVLDGYFHNAFLFLDAPFRSSSLNEVLPFPTGEGAEQVQSEQNIMVYCLEKFSIGLFNSLFLFLPTSTTHIITLRRFVMQGLEAGYISGLGAIAGNMFWLTSVIFGWRFFVIPWLSLDTFRYILGFILLVKYMWDSYNERTTSSPLANTTTTAAPYGGGGFARSGNKFGGPFTTTATGLRRDEGLTQSPVNSQKQKIFLFTFLLALTEQTSIYPFISNFSFSNASLLETFPLLPPALETANSLPLSLGQADAHNYLSFLFIHSSYLLGICLGCLSLLHFSCWFWENPAFKLYMWVVSTFKVSTGFYYKVLNFGFLYLTMLSAITSIPYYGLDYTITNPLGYVSDDRIIQDKIVLETSFLGTKASDRNTRRNRGRHGRRERWKRRIRKYRTFDASLYDQGIYDLFTIEDLNYGFDRFWLRRKLRNHRVRFRFFPGPWMRSFKKQLAKPRLESYTGPRIEFFRILFEQVYHPLFHAYTPIMEREGLQNRGFPPPPSLKPFLVADIGNETKEGPLPLGPLPGTDSARAGTRRPSPAFERAPITNSARQTHEAFVLGKSLNYAAANTPPPRWPGAAIEPLEGSILSFGSEGQQQLRSQRGSMAVPGHRGGTGIRIESPPLQSSQTLGYLKQGSINKTSTDQFIHYNLGNSHKSTLRKFVRKIDNRLKTSKILYGQLSKFNTMALIPYTPLYSGARGKEAVRDSLYFQGSQIQSSKGNQNQKNIKNIFYNKNLSKKDYNILRYRSLLTLLRSENEPHSYLSGVGREEGQFPNAASQIVPLPSFEFGGPAFAGLRPAKGPCFEIGAPSMTGGSHRAPAPNSRSSCAAANTPPSMAGGGHLAPLGGVLAATQRQTQANAEGKEDKLIRKKVYYNTEMLLHPLKFYLQQETGLKRKYRYYTPNIYRKFGIENNAPYFRTMLKRYFYNYKPTLRWERTMRVASLRKALRKTTRIPRKLQYNENLNSQSGSMAVPGHRGGADLFEHKGLFIDNKYTSTESTSLRNKFLPTAKTKEDKGLPSAPFAFNKEAIGFRDPEIKEEFFSYKERNQPPRWPGAAIEPLYENNNKANLQKNTYNYTVVSKKASRYRYQIYKDVLQHWYYSPFNRFLLKLDVDSFMRRQPQSHFLTEKEENLLHLRRFLLSEHYNTLRWYTNMEHYRSMKTQLNGSTKSFSSRAYNHQFAGTFKKIRHLFAITPSQSNIPTKTLPFLAFDSPLALQIGEGAPSNGQPRPALTDKQRRLAVTDVKGKEEPESKNEQTLGAALKQSEGKGVLKFDQPLYNEYTNTKTNSLINGLIIHEELLTTRPIMREDFVAEAQKLVRDYIIRTRISNENRDTPIKQLLNEQNYIELTKLFGFPSLTSAFAPQNLPSLNYDPIDPAFDTALSAALPYFGLRPFIGFGTGESGVLKPGGPSNMEALVVALTPPIIEGDPNSTASTQLLTGPNTNTPNSTGLSTIGARQRAKPSRWPEAAIEPQASSPMYENRVETSLNPKKDQVQKRTKYEESSFLGSKSQRINLFNIRNKKFMEDLYFTYLKKWKRHVNNQEALKNYLNRRVDKREKRKILKENKYAEKLKRLQNWLENTNFRTSNSISSLPPLENSKRQSNSQGYKERNGQEGTQSYLGQASSFGQVTPFTYTAPQAGARRPSSAIEGGRGMDKGFLVTTGAKQGVSLEAEKLQIMKFKKDFNIIYNKTKQLKSLVNFEKKNNSLYPPNNHVTTAALNQQIGEKGPFYGQSYMYRLFHSFQPFRFFRSSPYRTKETRTGAERSGLSGYMDEQRGLSIAERDEEDVTKRSFWNLTDNSQKMIKSNLFNYLGLDKIFNLIKPIKRKSLKDWRKRERAVGKQKRSSKEFKLLGKKTEYKKLSSYFDDHSLSLPPPSLMQGSEGPTSLQTMEPSRKKRDSGVRGPDVSGQRMGIQNKEKEPFFDSWTFNAIYKKIRKFKRKTSPQRRARIRRARGVFRKRTLNDSLKQDLKEYTAGGQSDLMLYDKIYNKLYLSKGAAIGGADQLPSLPVSKSTLLSAFDLGKSLSQKVPKIGFGKKVSDLTGSQEKLDAGNANEPSYRKEDILKQRKSKQKKQRSRGARQKRAKFSQKQDKYRKRRRFTVNKIRTLNKKFKKVKNIVEIQSWWWKNFIPSIQASTEALWQIEKDILIQQKLSQLETAPQTMASVLAKRNFTLLPSAISNAAFIPLAPFSLSQEGRGSMTAPGHRGGGAPNSSPLSAGTNQEGFKITPVERAVFPIQGKTVSTPDSIGFLSKGLDGRPLDDGELDDRPWPSKGPLVFANGKNWPSNPPPLL
uniref:Hypothetical chloroplast RF1 n=1 Tax=Stephanosphaera pluvialis TaxID=51712 RepID=A0A0S2IEG6_9CHLO|nr:hypothetical chloroplast RF1 [Stephanosphaera pluvialis]